MKIKITKCSKGSYWYADAIGYTYTVQEELEGSFVVMMCPTATYYVLKSDCEIGVDDEIIY